MVVLDDECGAERDVGSQLDVRTVGEGTAQLVLIHHYNLCPRPCQGEYREDEHHRRTGDGGWMDGFVSLSYRFGFQEFHITFIQKSSKVPEQPIELPNPKPMPLCC